MNVLIFAAGLGTRLKPLTDTMPKAMVPVDGKPLVQWLIEKLKRSGVTTVVINVHHFAQQIIDFIVQHESFGIDIRFSDETDLLLETGGGLKKAARLFPNE
ncbi:MAG: NTP transferase domain-containing protein, partial [Bacteroidaceae bacterium]|nr:NTP transferase domain-containing protein [Bacteroidaceae bacterium]